MILNVHNVSKLDVGGRGGKEHLISSLFPGATRVNAPLYDLQEGTERIEIKKQANLQWFDVGKYYNLPPEDRRINMVFLLHDSGTIDAIFSIKLGDFIDTVCSDEKLQKSGWTFDNIRVCYQQKRKHPSMQSKVGLRVRDFAESYPNVMKRLY